MSESTGDERIIVRVILKGRPAALVSDPTSVNGYRERAKKAHMMAYGGSAGSTPNFDTMTLKQLMLCPPVINWTNPKKDNGTLYMLRKDLHTLIPKENIDWIEIYYEHGDPNDD